MFDILFLCYYNNWSLGILHSVLLTGCDKNEEVPVLVALLDAMDLPCMDGSTGPRLNWPAKLQSHKYAITLTIQADNNIRGDIYVNICHLPP